MYLLKFNPKNSALTRESTTINDWNPCPHKGFIEHPFNIDDPFFSLDNAQ